MTISLSIPSEICAGDTVKWRRELPDFPAGQGWVLSYKLVSPTAVFSVVAVADGDAFNITIAASVSATYTVATHKITEVITKGTERYTLNSLYLRVLPDLAAATVGAETRTHAQKVLDAIELWLESKAPTAASFEIAGRKLQNYPLTELLALRDKYKAEVSRENRIATGAAPARILMRL